MIDRLALASFACVVLAGCHAGLIGVIAGSANSAGPYRGNELIQELGPGSVRTLGCLDVGFAIEDRPKGEHLDVHVGNRCAHPEPLDLKRVAITGFDGQGTPLHVSLSDPRGEIVELNVGAAERGREHVRIEKGDARAIGRLCFDVKGVAPDAPDSRPEPFCLVRDLHGSFKAEEGPRS